MEQVAAERQQSTSFLFRLTTVAILVGVSAGLGGLGLGLLLHFVQHIAFGYGLQPGTQQESFLEGVSIASALRRVVVLLVSGVIAGLGWWALYRFGRPLVPIRKAVHDGARMPSLTTALHDLLQIVTVGLGSPLGREVAPRELGAVFATFWCERTGLPQASTRILIACGAGAGLAAVYNVPLGGTLFTLEVLLGSVSPSAVIPAIVTSAIATVVAWIGLGNARQYVIPPLTSSTSLIVWSIGMGPILGLAARGFVRLTDAARSRAPRNYSLLPWCIGVFAAIGSISVFFPQLLGNGRSIAHLSFDSELSINTAIVLLILRLLITVGALRAGAKGGLLTPGLTLGALMGTIGGIFWNRQWPGTPVGAFALVGAIAFLATSMKMPLTAIALGFEFTGVGHDFYIPVLVAVAGAIGVDYLHRPPSNKVLTSGLSNMMDTASKL